MSNKNMQILKHVAVAAVSSKYVSKVVGLISLSLASIVINETIELVKLYFWRNYITELEVSNNDKCYPWLLQWISKYNQHLLHFSVNTICRNTESGHMTSKFDYKPSSGEHMFKYKGHTIRVKLDRSSMLSPDYGYRPYETLYLSTLGRNRQVLEDILEEAKLHAMSLMELGTTLMVPSYDTWQNFGEPRIPRSMTSVILDEGVIENILKDIHDFVNDQSWYLERGIPYRRGYLLYGPPGCGKTSMIMALAGEIKYSLCVLSLNDSKMSDDQLVQLMGEVPSKSFVLLEDIDAMFANRDGETVIAKEGSTKVTLSGLLNALDGVVSSEGRILFMTTNYVDRLDSALIRSGRVDFKQYIGTCSDYQLSKMFIRFRPEGTEDDKNRFVKDVRKYNKPVVPAHLQEFFLLHRHKELNYVFEHINDLWQNVQDIQLTE
ncbi:mitochondrial chaperone BCS1-like isoform X2 [Rhopalosiphum maidis]|uniref:mitochondrial chaperone BCS1-like isoform X2 n=1 Tax=Rhopalosiphum maidis TaxID=43146 RepID=UPI000EFF0214|nr:mitochondrial chaperone BCS1-like isoform X2 [Rhopalosiphum maidis]